MIMKKTLSEVTPNKHTKGIFYFLAQVDTDQEFTFLHGDSTLCDMDYYDNRSGDKIISPLLASLLEEEQSETVTDALMTKLANLIMLHSKTEWLRLQEAFNTTYVLTQKYKEVKDIKHTGTDTTKPGSVETVEAKPDENDVTTQIKRNGFNYPTASVPTDDTKVSQKQKVSKTMSGSDDFVHGHNINDTTTRDVSPEEQQARIESVISFWSNKDYLTLIYRSVDDILTTPIYK